MSEQNDRLVDDKDKKEKKAWSRPEIIQSAQARYTEKFTVGFEFTTPNGNQYGNS